MTISNTSSKRHWLHRDVLLLVCPEKSDNRLGWRGRSLISFFSCQLSQALALPLSKCRKTVVSLLGERHRGTRSNLLREQPLRLIAPSSSSYRFC